MMVAWYALSVIGGSELEMAERIRTMGYRAEAPTETIRVRIRRRSSFSRTTERKVPLLSGYVLVRLPQAGLQVIAGERDAIDWVRMGGEPVAIRDSVVERFLSDPHRQTMLPVRRALAVGMEVELTAGALRGQAGRLARIKKHRAIVTLRSGRELRDVDVPLNCVEAA